MIITKKQRANIIKHLPEGFREILAEECRCHVNTISNVLNQGRDNDAVAAAIIRLAAKTKKEKEKEHRELALIAAQL